MLLLEAHQHNNNSHWLTHSLTLVRSISCHYLHILWFCGFDCIIVFYHHKGASRQLAVRRESGREEQGGKLQDLIPFKILKPIGGGLSIYKMQKTAKKQQPQNTSRNDNKTFNISKKGQLFSAIYKRTV